MKSQKLSGAVAGSQGGAPAGGGVGAVKVVEGRGAAAQRQKHGRKGLRMWQRGGDAVAMEGRYQRRPATARA